MQHHPGRMIAVAALLVVALLAAVPALAQSGPERIDIAGTANLFSGGLAYDAAEGHFLLASAADNTIYAVADDGTLTPLIQDEALTAASSLYVDSTNRLLYVVNGLGGGALQGFAGGFGGPNGQLPDGVPADFTPPAPGEGPAAQQTLQPGETFGGQFPVGQFDIPASLLVYDLGSGTRLQDVDLSRIVGDDAQHSASDVAVDAAGNAYISDPLAGVIYMVDPVGNTFYMANDAFAAQQPQGDAQPSQDEQAGPGGQFGGFGGLRRGNGITAMVYHPDGYLLVANSGAGTLWKVPLDNPANVTEVVLAEPLTGISDMALDAQGRLVALTSARAGAPAAADAAAAPAITSSAVVLSSSDGWASAAVAAQLSAEENAQAAAVVTGGDSVYALYRSITLPADDPVTPSISMVIARLALGG